MEQAGRYADFRRYWIFQGRPDRYDLEEKLIPGETEQWTVSRYENEIGLGDVAYFWRGGRQPGMWGWGVVTGPPNSKSGTDDLRVEVLYQGRFDKPLSKNELLDLDAESGALSVMQILRAPQGTNFKLTSHEAVALNRMLKRHGPVPEDPPGIYDEELPALNLLPYTFSTSTTRVVGAGLVEPDQPLTGILLFNVLLALSHAKQAPPQGIVLFLREIFGPDQVDPGALLGAVENPAPLEAELLERLRMSIEALDIAEAARQLAIRTTGRDRISIRHLTGALLMAGRGGLLQMIENDCLRGERTLADFVDELAKYVVATFPQDDTTTWLSQWKPAVDARLHEFDMRRIRRRTKGSGDETAEAPPEEAADEITGDASEPAKAASPLPADEPEPTGEEDADEQIFEEPSRAAPDLDLDIDVSETEPETEDKVIVDDEEEEKAEGEAEGEPPYIPVSHFAAAFAGRPVPDRPSGNDLLNIEAEVKALAHLFALCDEADRDDEPDDEDGRSTFALGLFGRWGAGKSFFIDKMKRQIDAYRDLARTGKADGSRYCKQIVQIDFNAWHYNEADIWASLVHHIFDTLQKHFEKEAQEKEFKALIRQLEISQRQRQEIREQLETKQGEREMVAGQLASKKAAIDANVAEQLGEIGTLSRVAVNPQLRVKVKEVLGEAAGVMGLPIDADNEKLDAAGASVQGLLTTLQESGALASRTQSSARTILHSAFTPGFLVAGGVALAAYAGIPIVLEKPTLWDDLFSGIAQGAIAATPVLAWFGSKLKKTNAVFDKIAGVESALRDDLRREAEEKDEILQTLRRDHARLESEIGDGHEVLAALDDDIREIQARLDELGSPESLVDFINERAASDDYRSKLGILALIRSDFEKLSRIMVEKQTGDDGEPLPTLDRIILYIDDLDRVQESGKVLQVLEAVHLLLAFPLFHVVVAVDERWAARSVLHHHRAFFELAANGDNDDEGNGAGRNGPSGHGSGADAIAAMQALIAGEQSATPREFLEKIFQICFWVRPLSTQLSHELINGMVRGDRPAPDIEPLVAARMVAGVLDRDVAGEADEVAEPVRVSQAAFPSGRATTIYPSGHMMRDEPEPVPAKPAFDITTDDPEQNPLNEGFVPPPLPDPAVSNGVGEGGIGENGDDDGGSNDSDTVDLDVGISEPELITMRALSRVVGRSPRTVKRFINTYRLFKAMRIPPGAGVPPDDSYGRDDIANFHVPIMVLLAIQIGHPDVAFHLFEGFNQALAQDDTQTVGKVIRHLEKNVPGDVNPDKWQAALDSFFSVHDLWGDTPTLIDLGVSAFDFWLLGTSRFGFKEWVPSAERLWG